MREKAVHLAVSDHALMRYLERGLGYDIAAVEQRVIAACGGMNWPMMLEMIEKIGIDVQQTKRNTAAGAHMKNPARDRARSIYINWRGVVLVVKDHTIVTVLDRDNMPAKFRPDRARRHRRRDRRHAIAAGA